jgi:hypothetical protein
MFRISVLSAFVGLIVCVAFQASASTILDFNAGGTVPTDTGSTGNGDPINNHPGYGDNETATPDIVVDFPVNGELWNTGYGDLAPLVLTPKVSAAPTFTNLEIKLSATALNQGVSLNGFDVAGWNAPRTADYLRIIVDGNAVYSQTSFVFPNPGHASITAGGPWVGTVIQIQFDGAINNDSALLGIDNISFDQVALPEPSSAAAVVFGAASLLKLRRRKA